MAVSGDTRPATSPSTQQVVAADAPVRASLSSRSMMRAEVSLPQTPITQPVVTPPEPEPVVEPEPEVTPQPVAVAPVAQRPAVPATCPSNQFCYPRVGIAGAIVPYNDCSGRTDVGTAIRSIVCVSPNWLAAHAFTQFGRIANWRPGDVVFAYGSRYVVYDGFTQGGCVPPARAIAPLSLQTSLTSATCGPILVVQARPG